TSEIFLVAAIQTRKTARERFAASAIAIAPATSTKRREIDSRFSSPKNSPVISAVCNERTPLHASFTPTSPLLTRMRFPSSCVGIPNSVTVYAATAATARIRPWMMGTSIGVTHGTATKKNAIGKAKWRVHGFPPDDHLQ